MSFIGRANKTSYKTLSTSLYLDRDPKEMLNHEPRKINENTRICISKKLGLQEGVEHGRRTTMV